MTILCDWNKLRFSKEPVVILTLTSIVSLFKVLGDMSIIIFSEVQCSIKIIASWVRLKSSRWFQNNSALNKLFSIKLSSSFEHSTLVFILGFLYLYLVLFVTGLHGDTAQDRVVEINQKYVSETQTLLCGPVATGNYSQQGCKCVQSYQKATGKWHLKSLQRCKPFEIQLFHFKEFMLREEWRMCTKIHNSLVYNSKTNKMKHRNVQL